MILLLLIFPIIGGFLWLSFKYRNPYKLYMVFGKKGAGKTTYLTMTALKAAKAGRPVYSTVRVPYAKKLNYEDIGFRTFPANAVLLIDEVGMIWDNRNFKAFKPEVRDYFKLQRHYKHTVYLFSQTFDVDKKLRDLTDKMFLLSNPFGWFSFIRSITRSITVTQATGEGESRIADQLHISGFFGLLVGSTTIMLIPKYKKYFDSFELFEDLADDQSEYWDPVFTEWPKKSGRFSLVRLRRRRIGP